MQCSELRKDFSQALDAIWSVTQGAKTREELALGQVRTEPGGEGHYGLSPLSGREAHLLAN